MLFDQTAGHHSPAQPTHKLSHHRSSLTSGKIVPDQALSMKAPQHKTHSCLGPAEPIRRCEEGRHPDVMKNTPHSAGVTDSSPVCPWKSVWCFGSSLTISQRPRLQQIIDASALPSAHGSYENKMRPLLGRALKVNCFVS